MGDNRGLLSTRICLPSVTVFVCRVSGVHALHRVGMLFVNPILVAICCILFYTALFKGRCTVKYIACHVVHSAPRVPRLPLEIHTLPVQGLTSQYNRVATLHNRMPYTCFQVFGGKADGRNIYVFCFPIFFPNMSGISAYSWSHQ